MRYNRIMKIMYIKCKKYNISKLINMKNMDELGYRKTDNTIYVRFHGKSYTLLKLNTEDDAETVCTHILDAYISKSMSMDSFTIDIDDILKEIHDKQ